jgi:hypothetical protein
MVKRRRAVVDFGHGASIQIPCILVEQLRWMREHAGALRRDRVVGAVAVQLVELKAGVSIICVSGA